MKALLKNPLFWLAVVLGAVVLYLFARDSKLSVTVSNATKPAAIPTATSTVPAIATPAPSAAPAA